MMRVNRFPRVIVTKQEKKRRTLVMTDTPTKTNADADRKITVLLADKHHLRKPMAHALTDHGFKVIQASTRVQAISAAVRADIVVLGNTLTSHDGMEVIKEIRRRPETRSMPVIAHASNEDPQFEKRVIAAGAQGVLKNPFDYDSVVLQVRRLAGEEIRSKTDRHGADRSEEQIVRMLAALLESAGAAVAPRYDAAAASAYTYPLVEEYLGARGDEGAAILDDLVSDNILDRRLEDKVHRCPRCEWHTLNFVETCPRCESIDIEIQKVLHHFSCAYVGPAHEFRRGGDLVCPKCDDRIRHLGRDYESPADTYVCGDCRYTFTESRVTARCFRCKHAAPAEQVSSTPVYAYTANARTRRAVDYGRLHGLDINAVLFNDESRTFRKDYLVFELDREVYRARRYDNPLSLILISMEIVDTPGPAVPDAKKQESRAKMFAGISEALRDLDLVSELEDGLGAVLLPETAAADAEPVANRIRDITREHCPSGGCVDVVPTVAVASLEEGHGDGMDLFNEAYRTLAWAMENKPGSIVSHEQLRDGQDWP